MSIQRDTAVASLSPSLQGLATDYITWRLEDNPEFATLVGFHDYDERLDDMSLEAYKDRYDRCQNFLQRANTLEEELTHHTDTLNLRVLKTALLTYMEGYQFKGFLLPLCYISGVHLDFELLVSWMPFKGPQDYRKLLSRLERLPLQLIQLQELMNESIRTGIIYHITSMKGVSESLKRFSVASAEDSPLWKKFAAFPDTVPAEDATDIRTQARRIIVNQLLPAFEKLRLFMEEYERSTRPDLAVSSLPNGVALYRQLVRFHTTTNMAPEEIHQLGKTEVARLQGEMAKIVAELGFDMPVSEFSAMIRNDAKFYFTDPNELLQEVQRLVKEVIAPKLPEVFATVPKTELKVVDDPSPDGTLAFYQHGSHDGSRPGMFKVNTCVCSAQPKYDLLTLTLHEGNPGHHLHSSFLMESIGLPLFRKLFDDRNYQHAPSRFPTDTAFLEGWALYAEKLGFDMNLFDDPYERYGYYSSELYRACRLVVDTGLHCFGWTWEEAVTYMMNHTSLAQANVENEVRRYITFPGQALAYKIGQLKIQELREKATAALGEKFSLKEFHNVVLTATGPLDLLEEEVRAWITAHSAQGGVTSEAKI